MSGRARLPGGVPVRAARERERRLAALAPSADERPACTPPQRSCGRCARRPPVAASCACWLARAVLADICQLLTAFPRHYDLLLIKAQAEMNARNAQVAIATLEELSSLEPERVSVRKCGACPLLLARTLARNAPHLFAGHRGKNRGQPELRILAEIALRWAV